jgi:Na+/H+ antiporter NhaD/arsenite permease-like protein
MHIIRIFSSNYQEKVYIALNLSIAYSSSIGGSATLIGSGAPLLLKGIMEQ